MDAKAPLSLSNHHVRSTPNFRHFRTRLVLRFWAICGHWPATDCPVSSVRLSTDGGAPGLIRYVASGLIPKVWRRQMRRCEFMLLVVGGVIAWPLLLRSQQPGLPFRDYLGAKGLMSWGAANMDLFRRTGDYPTESCEGTRLSDRPSSNSSISKPPRRSASPSHPRPSPAR